MLYAVKSKSKNLTVSIEAEQKNIHWNGNKISLFQIGQCESDMDEYPIDWIPTYLLEALDRDNTRNAAMVAIADYLAGWASV